MKKVLIINGPNLNLLGRREPLLYGNQKFEDYLDSIRKEFTGITIHLEQFSGEDEIIDSLHLAQEKEYDGVVLNPAAYTHTSIGIGDAVAAINIPVIEVHISNLSNREAYRSGSFVSKYAIGIISGFGLDGYRLAISQFAKTGEQS